MKPRLIRISPSSIERVVACPGSHAAEAQCQKGWESSAAAEEGQLLHAAIRPDFPEEKQKALTFEQKRVLGVAKAHARRLVMEHLGTLQPKATWEARAQMSICDIGILSGVVDWSGTVADGRCLVIDWKFGRATVAEATDNLQMMCYALLLKACIVENVDTVVVALVQPTVEFDRQVTTAIYHLEDIEVARQRVEEIARAAADPAAKRTPGDHCRYCKALGSELCPESAEEATAVAGFARADLLPTGIHLGEWLDRANIAQKVVDMLKDHAKAELAAGRRIPAPDGYEYVMSADIPIRTLPDPTKAWEQVQHALKPKEFMAVCKVGVGDLQAAMQEHFAWPSKIAKAQFNDLMGDAIVMDKKSGSLKKLKDGGLVDG